MKPKQCGAKTRQGTPCKRAPTITGRCNLHGGKSLLGIAHPNYKHGYYSKYSLVRPLVQAARLRARIRERAQRRVAKELEMERLKREERKKRAEGSESEWNVDVLLQVVQMLQQQEQEEAAEADKAK